MIKKIFTLILVASTLSVNAQERCGTEVITKQIMANNPDYALARAKVNIQTEQWIKDHPNHSEKTIITIPVVVHVVYSINGQGNPVGNISDAQIQSQIDVLNKDYRRTNIDHIMTPNVWQSIAADCEIEFCLAATDPNGQPTNGINRIETTHGQFGMDSDIHTSSAGGADDWPNDHYLNIWVCNLGSGLLGYATPPSGWIGDGDGVVIGYNYFGTIGTLTAPYNKGRTTTHEIGHWLNLEHLWGAWGTCGNDDVSDTPKQEVENYGVPSFPHNINSCGTTNPNGDMFMNYMDYTNDAVMNLFTNGQKTRMLAAIDQYRPNMLSHNLCNEATNILEMDITKKELVKIIDILGRETNKQNTNTPLFYIYNDGSVEKKIIVE
ncbi:MAG: zinc metalloprotease [Bacteroidota bacterium]|nr:zinc metalloprotease [Bacteroidota bacterium]